VNLSAKSSAPHSRSAASPRRRTLLVLGVEEAFAALAAEPGVKIHAFSHDWALIDRARAIAALRGIAHRISIHHQAALASFRRAS
jgi:hypothetical protein